MSIDSKKCSKRGGSCACGDGICGAESYVTDKRTAGLMSRAGLAVVTRRQQLEQMSLNALVELVLSYEKATTRASTSQFQPEPHPAQNDQHFQMLVATLMTGCVESIYRLSAGGHTDVLDSMHHHAEIQARRIMKESKL